MWSKSFDWMKLNFVLFLWRCQLIMLHRRVLLLISLGTLMVFISSTGNIKKNTKFSLQTVANPKFHTFIPSARPYPGVHELSLEEPYFSRILKIQKECKHRKQKKYNLNSSSFKYENRAKVVMCETPKAASTAWQLLLLRLAGYQGNFTKDILQRWAYGVIPNKRFDQISRNEAWKRARNYTSFLITRHPFERLVSAYYDKFSQRSSYLYYRKSLGRKIARAQASSYLQGIKISTDQLSKMKPQEIQSLKEFTLLEKSQQQKVMEYMKALKNGILTFPQFVKYLTIQHKEGMIEKTDIHWRPQTMLCQICAFNYSYIIRFENLVSESNRLLTYLQETNLKTLPKKLVFSDEVKGSVHEEDTKEAFKQLPEDDVDILRKIYKDDFKFFNFDAYKYKGS